MNKERIATFISFDDEDTSTGFIHTGNKPEKPDFRDWFQEQLYCCIEPWDDVSERWYFYHPDQSHYIIELAYCMPYDLPGDACFDTFKDELKGISQYGSDEFIRVQNIRNRFDQSYVRQKFKELEEMGDELIRKYERL